LVTVDVLQARAGLNLLALIKDKKRKEGVKREKKRKQNKTSPMIP
jgi:hypothetical protein